MPSEQPVAVVPQRTPLVGFPWPTPRAVEPWSHTSLLGLDIVSFNAPYRDEDIQRRLRQALYEYLQEVFAITWLPWAACHTEDRGDGALIVLPPGVPPYLLLDPLAHHLDAALRRGNRLFSAAAQMRLRMAVHQGYVQFDAYGVVGHAVNHMFRLLDSAVLKEAIETAGADLGVIVSDRMFGDVAGHGGIIDPARYRPVQVSCKETQAKAWIWMAP
ncbi:hypothetical protein [Actinomadura sp. 9N407]|uniref:hypothetical protein n=1 Tax=Actinomadura sp. 9N407 TaxID=3375154 RepID=UPI00379079F1